MSTISISDQKFRSLIKEGVKEALAAEIAKLRALAVPEISSAEQRDIERRYGRPAKKRARSYNLEV